MPRLSRQFLLRLNSVGAQSDGGGNWIDPQPGSGDIDGDNDGVFDASDQYQFLIDLSSATSQLEGC